MKNIFLNIGITIGITLVQVILLLSMMQLLYLVRDTFVASVKIDLYWGRNLWLGLRYLFLPSFMLANIVVSLSNRPRVVLLMNVLLLSSVSYMWLSTLASYPYRSLAIYVIYIILFIAGIYLIKKWKLSTR